MWILRFWTSNTVSQGWLELRRESAELFNFHEGKTRKKNFSIPGEALGMDLTGIPK